MPKISIKAFFVEVHLEYNMQKYECKTFPE